MIKFNNASPDIGERMLRMLIKLTAEQEGVTVTDLVITKKAQEAKK